MDVAIIEKEALQLPETDRAVLVDRLIESISKTPSTLRESWAKEADSRIDALEAGLISKEDDPQRWISFAPDTRASLRDLCSATMTYTFLSPALAELTDAADYYEEQLPGLGADFIDEIDATIDRILNFPEAWARISDNYRHCNLRRFPYAVIYKQLTEEEILIVAVFHQSREPASWRDNL